jgi:hypothetical protein
MIGWWNECERIRKGRLEMGIKIGNEANIGITNEMMDLLGCQGNDYTCNGKCSECGACCTDCLELSDEEIDIIKDYISQHDIKPCNHIPVLAAPGTSIDFLCPFVNIHKESKRCSIYEVRPMICRAYICSSKSINDILKRLSKEEKEKIKESLLPDGKRRPPINLGQTFFPDIYTPKKGDNVVINKRYPSMQILNANMVFHVMTEPDEDNKVIIQWKCNPDVEYKFDVAGLTKLR